MYEVRDWDVEVVLHWHWHWLRTVSGPRAESCQAGVWLRAAVAAVAGLCRCRWQPLSHNMYRPSAQLQPSRRATV